MQIGVISSKLVKKVQNYYTTKKKNFVLLSRRQRKQGPWKFPLRLECFQNEPGRSCVGRLE